jgi:hypothetical protein
LKTKATANSEQQTANTITANSKHHNISIISMEETYYDEIGRIFCKKHKRGYCHECCFDFRDQNERVEEDTGHKKKRTPMEEAANMWAVCVSALSGMERMVPRPNEEIFKQNRKHLSEYEEKLRQFAAAGEDVEPAKKRALEKERASNLEMHAFTQAMSRQNPGQREFGFGGAETQKIYDQFLKPPDAKMGGPICIHVRIAEQRVQISLTCVLVARQYLTVLRNVKSLTGRFTKRSVPSERMSPSPCL